MDPSWDIEPEFWGKPTVGYLDHSTTSGLRGLPWPLTKWVVTNHFLNGMILHLGISSSHFSILVVVASCSML